MRNNPLNTSVAPGENSACRTAAALAAAKASTGSRPATRLNSTIARVGVGLAVSASDVREEKVAAIANAVKRGTYRFRRTDGRRDSFRAGCAQQRRHLTGSGEKHHVVAFVPGPNSRRRKQLLLS